MKPGLAGDYRLNIRHRRAYIERVSDNQAVAALWPAEAVALSLMNGRRSWNQLQAAVREAAGENGVQFLQSLRGRLMPLLADGSRTNSPVSIDALAGLLPPDEREGLRPLPGPRVLHWCVTQYCPRQCASDATLSRDRLQSIFSEAAALGAQHLLAGGSEPFLRQDLPEILGDAQRFGIAPSVTTKYPISLSIAERLAKANIRHISLSVDSMDAEQNRLLVGSGIYPEQVRASAMHLRSQGISFSIQSVLTAMNTDALDGVADFAEQSGAIVMQVAPFERVRRPIGLLSNEAIELSGEQLVEEIVARLQHRHRTLKVELFEALGSGSRTGYNCDIGVTKLFFLPDGTVHRCYKLTADTSLCGLNLKHVSVARAWHDPDFSEVLHPARERYQSTGCGACSHFDACHDDGRCIYAAMVRYGQYAAPDRDCGGPFLKILIHGT
jgi:radical SAM protein with 4Fe4S-binding SPASM domain